ncbi:MAG: hypothetical protein ACW9WZ_05970 [Nitrosopumilus sp.]|jgi:hypothetical protein
MNDDLPDTVKKCIDLLEENLAILSNLEYDLNDEQEDKLQSDLKLHQLYDMAEDVSESSKLKRAESNFVRRMAED